MKTVLLTLLLLVVGFTSQSGCRTCQTCRNACGDAHVAMNSQAAVHSAYYCPSGTCPLMAENAAGTRTPNLITFEDSLPPTPITDQE